MVSSGDGPVETKDTPEYALALVQQLLRQSTDEISTYHFAGTRISVHLAKMGFEPSDVTAALLSLSDDHFVESLRYEGPVTSWHDVYLMKYQGTNGNVYDLYIKFRLTKLHTMVIVCSFHPEGWE